jgi:putative spermidine/putrescine transport system ATP-binding protein
VYEHPVTEFVAGFVGTSNVFSAEQVKQLFGEDASFTLRPEKIVIGQTRELGRSISGVVTDVEYLGPMTRYFVEAQGTRITVLEQNDNDRFLDVSERKGKTVTLTWSKEAEQPIKSFSN